MTIFDKIQQMLLPLRGISMTGNILPQLVRMPQRVFFFSTSLDFKFDWTSAEALRQVAQIDDSQPQPDEAHDLGRS